MANMEVVGTKIRIIEMVGFPEYDNKEGVVTKICKKRANGNSYDILYGTWGDGVLDTEVDTVEILNWK